MAQTLFASNASPSLPNLDANFNDLYGLANFYKTPTYTGTGYRLEITSGGLVGLSAAASAAAPLVLFHMRPAATDEGLRIDNAGAGGFASFWQAGSRYGLIGSAAALISGGAAANYAIRAEGVLIFASNGGNERARFDINGNFILALQTSAPALGTNGNMVFALTSNTNLRVSVRGADGVTRVANITLA